MTSVTSPSLVRLEVPGPTILHLHLLRCAVPAPVADTLLFRFSAAGPAVYCLCHLNSGPLACCCLLSGDDCTSLYNPERLFRAHKGCNSVSVTVSIKIKVEMC